MDKHKVTQIVFNLLTSIYDDQPVIIYNYDQEEGVISVGQESKHVATVNGEHISHDWLRCCEVDYVWLATYDGSFLKIKTEDYING